MENQIAPFNSNLSVRQVGNLLKLTDKLKSSSKTTDIILLNSESYREQKSIEKLIIKFIKANFWYFLNAIKYNYIHNKLFESDITSSVIDLIKKENRKNIEFPNTSHRTRGGGGGPRGWSEMSEHEKKEYHKNKSPISKDLYELILFSMNSRITGEIFNHYNETSVGHLLGIKINKNGW